jgi:arylsulfatase A-like enzyme
MTNDVLAFLKQLCFLPIVLGIIGVSPVVAAEASPPNLLIIVADDLGYSDLGCYGGEIETPNLDRLAANGLKFSQFYNTGRCWSSRAAILTGYYAQQVRRDALPKMPASGARGVRQGWARLLPDILKPLGYRSYHSGKWHVDGMPLKNGFDRSYSLDDHDRFFAPRQHTEDDKPLAPVDPTSGYYATTSIAEHSIKCLREHADKHQEKPFFQYLCFTAPHFPLHALPEDIAKYRTRYLAGWDVLRDQRFARQRELGLMTCDLSVRAEKTAPRWNPSEEELQRRIGAGEIGRAVAWRDLTEEQQAFQAGKMAIHAAMVDRMDREIGRVLEQLMATNSLDNTLIMFLSDNGASAEQIIRGDGHDPAAAPGSAGSYLGLGPGWSTVSNSPFRMHKSWVHEGGISTPLIVHWPAGIAEKGGLRHTASHVIDIVPTLLEVTKARRIESWNHHPVPVLPGSSLTPAFAKDIAVPHEFLWWFHEGNRAVRVGDWKLVSWGVNGPWELFDMQADRSETRNLAATMPDKVRELEQLWKAKLEEFQDLALLKY